MNDIPIKRALISVHDKNGLLPLANLLQKQGVEIIASGSTADYLKKNNIATSLVSDITGFPEVLGGRVKTLHPHIHAGILARPNNPDDEKELAQHNIKKIDLVVVGLYPFEEGYQAMKPYPDMVELIDIGGVTLIRAAAKNHQGVAVVTNPDDYPAIIKELEEKKSLSLATRRHLAINAFTATANYEKTIADWFNAKPTPPSPLGAPKKLRYGENPHQSAHFIPFKNSFGLSAIQQLHGKELSYNNYVDLDAALRLLIGLSPLNKPTALVIKHTDPSGVAVKDDIITAFHSAFASDPISAFGGIIGINQPMDASLANEILSLKVFFEIILAPSFSDEAVTLLSTRKDLRLIALDPLPKDFPKETVNRVILGGVLEQDRNHHQITKDNCEVVSQKQPTPQEWQDMLMGMMIVKEIRSNAIAIIAGGVTQGIGGGATSRVMAAEKAVANFMTKKNSIPQNINAVVASDAFLPFTDNVDLFASGGASAIIAPKGSVKDADVIKRCDEKNMALVFYQERHFYH